MTNLWILTEEKPKRSVVIEILKKYSFEFNKKIEVDSKGIIIAPIFEDKKYSFTCEVYGISVEGIENIYLKTVSGGSSFLDYLLFEQDEEPDDGDCSNMVMAFEETKTSDDESRNTGVYQRASKFAFIRAYSSTAKTYMLYNDELNARENKRPSDTSVFGTNMLLTLGVEILGKNNLSWFKPFTSIDELISAKNSMRRPPAGNVPIVINKYEDRIEVSGRLSKPAEAGNPDKSWHGDNRLPAQYPGCSAGNGRRLDRFRRSAARLRKERFHLLRRLHPRPDPYHRRFHDPEPAWHCSIHCK